MKCLKFYLVAILFSFSSNLYSQKILDADNKPQVQLKFCGLDTLHDSSLIDDCDSQSAQNVLTDRGYLEERTGIVRIGSVLSGFPVTSLYQYTSLSNTQYIIAQASNTAYAINSGNVVTISTLSAGTTMECASLSGSIICTDGSVPIWSYNGISTATVYGGAPICTYLETEYGRLFCGGPSSDLSQVAISSYTGFSYWTPSTISPLPVNSAATFEVNPNDGDHITCMKATPWGLFLGKRNSTYILKGYDNSTFYMQTIDPSIGCLDQRTFQMVNGIATWASQKGVYQWNGAGPPVWISEKIDPTYRGARQLSSNSNFWQIASQSDWQSGFTTLNGPSPSWDLVDMPGYIFPSSGTFIDSTTASFLNGTLLNVSTNIPNSLYVFISTGVVFQNAGGELGSAGAGKPTNWSMSNNCQTFANGDWAANPTGVHGNLTPKFGSNEWGAGLRTQSNVTTFFTVNIFDAVSSATLYTNNFGFPASGPNVWNYLPINVSSFTTSSGTIQIQIVTPVVSAIGQGCSGGANAIITSTPIVQGNYIPLWYGDDATSNPTRDGFVFDMDETIAQSTYAFFTSRIFDTKFSTPIYGPTTINFSSNTQSSTNFQFRVSTSPNNDQWDSYVTVLPGNIINTNGKRYIQYQSSFTLLGSTVTPADLKSVFFDDISTGNYYSPVHTISSAISAWKTINFQDFQQTPGEIIYYVRSATNPFSILSSTPNWVNQTNNQTVNVATGTFFQFEITSSSITSSTQAFTLANASVDRAITNWQEGISVRPASGFIDQRYFLCIILSTQDAINDGCLVFQRNRSWTLYNGPSISAISPYNFQLIGGDGSTNSQLWYLWQDGIYDDAGAVINSSWTTKDFIVGGSLFPKTYYETWVDNAYSPGSSLNVTWNIDKSTMSETKTINLDNNPLGTNPISNGFSSIQRVYTNSGSLTGFYIRFNFSQNLLDLPWRINDYYFFVDVEKKHT